MVHQHVLLWEYDRPPSLEQFRATFPRKLCRAMVDPRRELLGSGDETVMVDGKEMTFRQESRCPERLKGAPEADKIMIAGTVECHPEGAMARIRLRPRRDQAPYPMLHPGEAYVASAIAPIDRFQLRQ